MTNSSKKRHLARYYAAMDKLVEIDEAAVDDIDDYVAWLISQITTKRQTIQALNAEIDELRRGVSA